MTALVVIAKSPLAGQSKTRLCPPCTPDEAAGLARAALEDTLSAAAAASGPDRRVLALVGEPGEWLPEGFEVIPQRGDGLAERIGNAFADVGGPAVLIAMDTPQVTPGLLDDAIGRLEGTDAVLGPASDGGWWLLGLREPDPRVMEDVPMSSASTYEAQGRRLDELGLRRTALCELRDVDEFSDALEVARAAPDSRFAAAVGALMRGPRWEEDRWSRWRLVEPG